MTAILARRAATLVKYSSLERAFLAGLLHDIGKIMADGKFHDQYKAVVSEVREGRGLIEDVERRILGMDHAAIAEKVLLNWKFPDAEGEFVATMEEVLEPYENAYDPAKPVVCIDEQPVQLIGEARLPIPATKERPKRVDYDYEYKRKRTASLFLFAEPLSGFRQATARERRAKGDWAQEVAHLLDTRYAGVEQLTLVCDNLNTHTKGAFYEAFAPKKAREYVKRIDFVYTPEARQVAQCGRMRIELHDEPMFV